MLVLAVSFLALFQCDECALRVYALHMHCNRLDLNLPLFSSCYPNCYRYCYHYYYYYYY